jgi:hypothetical protein
MLEERHQVYVLAVRANRHLSFWDEDGLIETDPEALGDAISSADWAAHMLRAKVQKGSGSMIG